MTLKHAKRLVSIGMPVYNRERYMAQALDSVLAQGFDGFELIISDNASKDGIRQICLAYASKDRRNRYYYYRDDTNIGAAANQCL